MVKTPSIGSEALRFNPVSSIPIWPFLLARVSKDSRGKDTFLWIRSSEVQPPSATPGKYSVAIMSGIPCCDHFDHDNDFQYASSIVKLSYRWLEQSRTSWWSSFPTVYCLPPRFSDAKFEPRTRVNRNSGAGLLKWVLFFTDLTLLQTQRHWRRH